MVAKSKSSLAWLIGLLVLMPVHSHAGPDDSYPPIDSHKVASSSYEIRRLLCSDCGQVSDVVYLPARHSFFASTYQGDLWQIDRRGQVVDVLRGQGALPDSGVYFGEDTYIDWFFTGDPTPKPYREALDADHLSEEAFNARLQAADARSVRFAGGPNRAHYYLREGEHWRRLDRNYSSSTETVYMRPPKGVVTSYHRAERNSEQTLPFVRLANLSRDIGSQWRDPENPLYLRHYQRQGRSRKPFLDFHGRGWSGTYGRGHFHLRHKGEQLTFSAQHRVIKSGYKRDETDIDFYRLPLQHPAANIAFLGLYGQRFGPSEGETGFYVVKPRTVPGAREEAPASLQSRYPWQPAFTGFDGHPGTLRQMIYINGEEDSPQSPLNRSFNRKSKPLPLVWNFFHRLPALEEYGHNYIKLNQTFYFVRDKSSSTDGHFYTKLYFDREETRTALAQLQGRKDLSGPLMLTLAAEWPPKGLVYHLAAQRGGERIALHKAYLDDLSKLEETPSRYVLYRLDSLFERAMQNSASNTLFIHESSHLVEHLSQDPEVAEAFASITVKLLITHLKNRDAETAEALFFHYIDTLLPRTGFHPKALDIASMALVLGIRHQRPQVIETTFRQLLDNGSIDIQTLRHDILVYNLACYYALQQQKSKMLQAAARAVALGKKPEQFLADNDFTRYWNDSEFLAVIYQEE